MTFYTFYISGISTKSCFFKHYLVLVCCLFLAVIVEGQVTEIEFSVERGFYDSPFTVALEADDPSATIRYTTNNTKPGTTSGTIYTGPINISNTTSIRAIAYTGASATPVNTHTYIFLDDIITASYMENNITNSATYGPQMRDALLAIPTISLVSNDLDSNNSIDTEVETSVEMFFPDGTSAFQVHSGIQTWGGSPSNLKKHYRLEFKSIYGTSKLKYPVFDDDGYDYPIPAVNEFNKLLLRGGSQDALNCEYCDESQAQFVRNRFIWDVQMEMGYPAPHGRFVHVYVNGEYMGHYHLMERPDEAWYESYYFPEKMREQVEVRKSDEYWNEPESPTFYSQMVSAGYDEDYIDKQQAADYAILNDYGANFDWGTNHNNLGGADPASGNGGYKFVVWDFDMTLGNPGVFGSTYGSLVNFNSLNNTGPIPNSVNSDTEFKVMQGDRMECHCFNDGVLTPAVLDEMYMKRANQVQLPLIAESARWGNKTFNPPTSHIPKSNWDVNDEWITERQDVRNNYFPNRTNNLLNYYQNAGRYPNTQSVQFSQFGGEVNSGYQLALSNPNAGGTIYYTTDGSDPRLEGGNISGSAQVYNGPITIAGPIEIRARVRRNGNWSAMCPRRFYVIQDRSPLVINEIHYHADSICRNVDWNETEYLEIKNTGNTTLNLTDCRFSSGITYTFPWNATIAPGQFIILAENAAIFQQEFGFIPYDQYKGELSNDGETLILVDYKNEVIDSVQFNDQNPWDEMPDGNGPSLELRHPSLDNADPLNWFRSDQACAGTPGQENSRLCATPATPIIINEINYNSNNDITDPGDWVELYNPNNTAVDISAWEFYDNDNQFIIPIGTIIQPDEYLVLIEDEIMFTGIFPHLTNYIGDFAFNLSKKGERISLFDTNKCMSDYVIYNDKAPWPTEPDGGGPTLSLINPYNGADNSLPASWESSSAINSAYGTPGRINEACQETNIVTPSLVCATVPALFTVANPDPNLTYSWFFSGGNPNFSDTDSTIVTWNNSGTYNVQLITKYYECTKVYNYPITIDCTVSDIYTTPEDVVLNDLVSNTTPTSTNNLISGTTNGTIVFNPDGSFTYTPDPEFSGMDNFIYETCDVVTVSDTTVYSSIKNYSGQVNSGANDVEENAADGAIEATSTDLDLMLDDGDAYTTIGVRITNVNVPTGAVITNAYLQFTADEAQSVTTNLSINAEAVGNASAFSNTAYSLSSKTPTNATSNWNNIPPWTVGNTYNSTDISNVIQEIIDRGDWANGNAMTFLIEGTGRRTAESANGVAASAPKLFIDYETVDSIVINPITTGTCIPSLVEINITPVNDQPTALDDSNTTNEDTSVSGNVQSNDSDVEDLSLTSTVVTPPANANVTLNATGAYTYTPDPDFNGTDTFEYQVCDMGTPVECDTATVTITVNSINDAPIILDDAETIIEDNILNGDVSINDSDAEGALMYNAVPVTPPANGTLSLNSNGSYVYTPNADFNGTDSFEYEACDSGTPVLCETATVTITITPTPDAPIAVDDNFSTNEEVTITRNITSNDIEPDGENLILNTSFVTLPANGSAFLLGSGFLSYTPNTNFYGTDIAEYEICDNGNPVLCDTATITIIVNPLPDAPIAVDDSATTPEDTPLNGDVLVNDIEPDGDNLIVSTPPLASPSFGTLVLNSNGTYTYTPSTNFNGTDSFEYEVCDDENPAQCDQAVVTITISNENDAPIAIDDTPTVNEDNILTDNVLNNDNDPEGNAMIVDTLPITTPVNGTLVLNSDGSYIYTPDPDFFGTDSFEYQVCDNYAPPACDTATVTISVINVNDAPIAVVDTMHMFANGSLQYNILLNDSDIENDNLTAMTTPMAVPLNGVLTIQPSGNIDYAPDLNYIGTEQFTYEVCDSGNPTACSTADVVIIIEPDCIDIQISLWMEGPYNPTNTEMTTTLNARGLLPGQTPASNLVTPTPAGQPYNRAPWNYAGTEGATWTDADYTADVVDWVLVAFRTGTTRSTEIAKTAALIHQDGTISFPNRCALTSGTGVDSVYILVEHRNHIGVMSPQPISITNGTLTYDFRTADSFRDPTSFGQKQLPTGEWAMYGGDINQSADITSYDINGQDKTIWVAENGIFDNYRDSDINMDSDITGADKILWFQNNGISSRVPK